MVLWIKDAIRIACNSACWPFQYRIGGVLLLHSALLENLNLLTIIALFHWLEIRRILLFSYYLICLYVSLSCCIVGVQLLASCCGDDDKSFCLAIKVHEEVYHLNLNLA